MQPYVTEHRRAELYILWISLVENSAFIGVQCGHAGPGNGVVVYSHISCFEKPGSGETWRL